MNAHTRAHTHRLAHARARAHTHQSHIRAMRLKKKVFKKRKVFKEDLKEPTEVEWRTETGSLPDLSFAVAVKRQRQNDQRFDRPVVTRMTTHARFGECGPVVARRWPVGLTVAPPASASRHLAPA